MTSLKKAGDHPLIAEYNKTIDSMEKRLEVLRVQIRDAKREEGEPKPRYWIRNVILKDKFWGSFRNERKIDGVVLLDILMNLGEKEAWFERWGSITGPWEPTRSSVTYYRTEEKILTSDGGDGWGFLKELPMIVSDEEWEAIKEGNIPERLIPTLATN